MDGYGGRLVLVLVLVLLNAVFAGSEMALVSLREGQPRRLERTSRGGKVLARLARDPNRYLATIQIGITLAGFLASAAAAVSLAEPLIEPLGFLGGAADAVAIILVTIVLTFFTLVVGELAPKRIAMQRAEGWALLAARPLDWLSTFSRPAVWLLGASTDLLVRLLGVDPKARRQEVTPEELRDMVASQRSLTAEHRMIISGAFEVADRILREILVPRGDVFTLDADLGAGEGLRELGRSGMSRAPVVAPGGGLDDVLGMVHLRDLIDVGGTVRDHVRPVMFLPETLKATDAIRQMRQEHEQFAIVVDERGEMDGIITMEDLVEEVVGEIYDETDRDAQTAVREPDGAVVLPGRYPIHDLPDVGVHLEDQIDEGDYTTVAGLVISRLGHIPKTPGEIVDLRGFTAQVVEITGHAVTKVRLRPKRQPAERENP